MYLFFQSFGDAISEVLSISRGSTICFRHDFWYCFPSFDLEYSVV
jgi:hypothetical protein